MEKLEALKHASAKGVDYWMAREIGSPLGYEVWAKFEPVIERAAAAMRASDLDPSHHIVLTDKMMERGKGAQAPGRDYFLTRAACYLIAMNGDPSSIPSYSLRHKRIERPQGNSGRNRAGGVIGRSLRSCGGDSP